MTKKEFAPVTPGEMLKEEFLAEYGLSQNQLAKAIGISPNRITEIVNNRRRITADTALRLSLLSDNPQMGRPGRVPGTREVAIPKTPFIVPYRLQRNAIQILRVYHGARRWPESI